MNKLSRYAWLACTGILLYSGFFFYPRWQQPGTEAAISWDVSGYYWYLPATFIYKDLKHLSFSDSIVKKYHPADADNQQFSKSGNGNYVMKYSCGMAVMYLPFFAAAHVLAPPLGYPADGFSRPYQLAIQLGGFLMAILGLWYCRKLLLFYYADAVVAVTLLLLVAGSNYLEYAAIDNGMSHSWLFTIYVFLLLNTHFFYQSFKAKYAVRIGLLIGLATLARPTEVIACLLPLLWGMDAFNVAAVKKQFAFYTAHFRKLAIAVCCAVAVICVQLIYWKYVSGNWLVYSYGDQGFSFLHPNFRPYTFSFRSGWLIYTPIMIFSLIGFVPFLRHGAHKVAIIIFFLIGYYIVCAWDIWWYGGRAMVQSYPVLLFPLAALVGAALRRTVILCACAPFALLFVYMNVWITYHYHKGALYEPDFMTKKYFWRVVGRWSAPPVTVVLRDNTDLYEGTPQNQQLVYEHDYENDTGAFITSNNPIAGKKSFLIPGYQVTPKISIPFAAGGAKWIRVQGTFHCDSREYGWNMPQFIVKLKDKNETDTNASAKYNMLRISRLLNSGETGNVSLDMQLPAAHYDSLQIWFKNVLSGKPLEVDDIKIWKFE